MIRLANNQHFDPAPDGYPGPCVLEVTQQFRSGRGRFYRDGAMGYTDCPALAGVWTGKDAFERVVPGKCYPVPLSHVVDLLLETVRILQEKL